MWFDSRKGYGFIRLDDVEGDDEDVFVHHTSLMQDGFRKLKADARVTLDIDTDSTNRTRAVNVQLVTGDDDE